jgi:hypothetical protein
MDRAAAGQSTYEDEDELVLAMRAEVGKREGE